MLKILLLGVALSMATVYTTYGQTQTPTNSEAPAASAAPPASTAGSAPVPAVAEPAPVEGRSLVGMKVQTQENTPVGRINNVVVGQDGRIDYAIIKVGGFLGLGSKKVTVAWNELRVDDQRGVVRIDKTKEQLMSEPEFREARKATS